MASESVGLFRSTSQTECTAHESQELCDRGQKLPDCERISDEARSKKEIWLRMKERRCEHWSSLQQRREKEDGLSCRGRPMYASTSSGPSGSSNSGEQCETTSISEQSLWTGSTSSCSSIRHGSGALNELLRSVFGKREVSSDSSGSQSQHQSTVSSCSMCKEPQINSDALVLGDMEEVLDGASSCRMSDDFDDMESVPDEHNEVPQEVDRILTATMHIQHACGPGSRFAEPPKVNGSLELEPKARLCNEGASKRDAPKRIPKIPKHMSAKCAESASKVGDSQQSFQEVKNVLQPPFYKGSTVGDGDSSPQYDVRRMDSTAVAVNKLLCKEKTKIQADFQEKRSRSMETVQTPGPSRTKRAGRNEFAEQLFDAGNMDESVDDLFLEYYHWRDRRGLTVKKNGGKQVGRGHAKH